MATFSKLHEWSPRSSTNSTAQRIICSPVSEAGVVALPLRAAESVVHGVLMWTCRSGAAGGSSTESLTSVATTVVVPGAFAPSSFKGAGSESTARTTSAPASSAPHVNPPRPAKRSHGKHGTSNRALLSAPRVLRFYPIPYACMSRRRRPGWVDRAHTETMLTCSRLCSRPVSRLSKHSLGTQLSPG